MLTDKVLPVTGGSAGIGRATAIAAAGGGADVAIINFGHDDGAVSAAAEIVAMGRRAIAVEGDVADRTTVSPFIERAVEAFERVDVLASKAGICPFHAFLISTPNLS